MDWMHWKEETLAYGHRFAGELVMGTYEPHVGSDGVHKYLKVYNTKTHDCHITILAPTYYDLFVSAQCAWNAYVTMRRGY